MNFKGKINILNDARGMWHQSCDKIDINLLGKEISHASTNYGTMMKIHGKLSYKKDLAFCKTFMTPKELQDYKDGKDVFYNEKQLLSLLKTKVYKCIILTILVKWYICQMTI